MVISLRGILLPIIFAVSLSACSTYVENRTSENFVPRYDEIMPAQAAPRANGSIYKASAKTGLFTTDQRARSIGDILTVVFAEGYAAQKAQSMSANKSNAMNVTAMPFDSNSLGRNLGPGQRRLCRRWRGYTVELFYRDAFSQRYPCF